MQKKKNTRFKAIDLIIILFCITGSAVSGAAFWQEYNRTFTKLNESPIGTISFKKRTAQRKFIDRTVWDRLKQSSEIYNGDTIRTIEFSEALITFRNEVTYISLSENTLIQVFYDDIEGVKIEFSGGNLEVEAGTGSVTIASGSEKAIVGGKAAFNRNDNGFSISVLDGETIFNGEKIEAGSIVNLTPTGDRNVYPAIQMKSFGTSARILTTGEEAAPVEFSWLESNFNSDTYVIIEVSLNKNFDRIVQKREVAESVSTVILLESGNYWWRVYPADNNSRGLPVNNMYPSGTIEVMDMNYFSFNFPDILPVTVITREPVIQPEPEPEIVFVPPSPPTTTTPSPPSPSPPRPSPPPLPPSPPQSSVITEPVPEPPQEIAEPEIAKSESPQVPPVIEEPVTAKQEPVPAIIQTATLDIKPEDSLGQPVSDTVISNIFPTNNFTVYSEQLLNTPFVYFSWNGNTDEYEFALYRADGEAVVPRTAASEIDTGSFAYVLANPEVLQEGEYIYYIYERYRKEEDSDLPGAQVRFIVSDEKMPEKIMPTVDPGELYGN